MRGQAESPAQHQDGFAESREHLPRAWAPTRERGAVAPQRLGLRSWRSQDPGEVVA